ncbi:MAG TPA: stage II sporulation protein M [Thermoanaerobacterales bacterium]|nr:stage II sporulation protein M [Thermoanaerobacterales bacterium]
MNYFPKIMIDYFRKNIIQYIFLSIILIIGIVIGSITVNLISDMQLENIQSFINGFLANVKNISVDHSSIFYLSISNNIKTAVLLIILGLSVIGIPFILGIILFRGFVLGFTVGFLIEDLGTKGLILAILSILPQNLIILPSIISIGVTALTFATTVIKNRMKNYHENYTQMVSGYMMLNLIFCFLLVISGLIEGYISPLFIRLFSNYFSL